MVRQTIADTARRAMHSLARATIKKISDVGGRRQLDIEVLKDEVHSDVEHFEQYGFTSVPLSPNNGKAEAVVAFIGGSRDHPVVIAVGDRRSRPKNRKEGESVFYDDQGQEIYISRAGIVITGGAKALPVSINIGSSSFSIANGKLTINCDQISLTGSSLKHNGHEIGSTHIHTGVIPGSGDTGPPV